MKNLFAICLLAFVMSFPTPSIAGEWQITQEQSALGDAGPLKITLPSQTMFVGVDKEKMLPASMEISCRNKEMRVFFFLPGFNEFTHNGIQYRLDQNNIITDESWKKGGMSSMFSLDPLPLLSALRGKEKLAIRFGIKAVDPIEMIFDVSGFDEVAEEITKSCGIEFKD